MTEEPEVILEPGDPGYVAPAPEGEEPSQAVPPPPAQDLRLIPEKGESDAEFMARTHNTVVDSQSPADIVPNWPQISMGPQPTEGETPPEEGQEAVPEEPPAEEAKA
jgi:hypothetical protein